MNTLVERAEALATDVTCTRDSLSVTLSDGRVVSVPLAWFPLLPNATVRQRAEWELIGGGIGIHWEAIDEDISVASLLQPYNFTRMPAPGSKVAASAGERSSRKKGQGSIRRP